MRGEATPIGERGGVAARLPRATLAAVSLLAAGALIAGCGGGGPSGSVASLGSHGSSSHTSTGSAGASEAHQASPASQAVAYAACMREHGVPNFPEPQVTENGSSTSIKIAVPAKFGRVPAFKRAGGACRKLLPGGEVDHRTARTPAEQQQYLRAAACIRSHGVPNFPDPTFSGGNVHIEHQDLNENSPAFKTAVHDCESLIPGGVHTGSAHVQEAAPAP